MCFFVGFRINKITEKPFSIFPMLPIKLSSLNLNNKGNKLILLQLLKQRKLLYKNESRLLLKMCNVYKS